MLVGLHDMTLFAQRCEQVVGASLLVTLILLIILLNEALALVSFRAEKTKLFLQMLTISR